MGVSEGRTIGLDEGGMTRHSQIRPHVAGRMTLRIQKLEAKGVGGTGGQRDRAVPHHAVAVGQLVRRAEFARAERRSQGGGIVRSKRSTLHGGWNV